MNVLTVIEKLLQGGLGNLAAYLAAHVLLCLLPAFFIAVGMSALIPKEAVSRFLGMGGWLWASIGLIVLTLLTAAVKMTPSPAGLEIGFTSKLFGTVIILLVIAWMIRFALTRDELRDWFWESWRFIKQIFPLLIAGVFAVGVLRQLIRSEWIETLAGKNTLLGNLAGVIFGVFMYFPTLVEVPIAKMFLRLGMYRGPLLDYLMADPELSLQSILIISTIIGRLKTWTYVGWVDLFCTLAGLIYGSWVDGAAIGWISFYLIAFLILLGVSLWLVKRQQIRSFEVK